MKLELTYKKIKKKIDKLFDLNETYLYNEYNGGVTIMPIKNKTISPSTDTSCNDETPSWFLRFEKINDARWEKQEEFNKSQLEFNKSIMQRLDNVEDKVDYVSHRLDNIVTKNNLSE